MQVGDKVVWIGGTFDGERGVIESVFSPERFTVRQDDGSLHKVTNDEIELAPEPKSDTITISRTDFRNAINKVVTPKMYVGDLNDAGMITVLCLAGEVVCNKLERVLFGEND